MRWYGMVERFIDGDGEGISITNDARSTVGQMETCFYFPILLFYFDITRLIP
jgi:hypothetical protein